MNKLSRETTEVVKKYIKTGHATKGNKHSLVIFQLPCSIEGLLIEARFWLLLKYQLGSQFTNKNTCIIYLGSKTS